MSTIDIEKAHSQMLTILVQDRMKGLLPDNVIKRIYSVSEEYMLSRFTSAIKVRFFNGQWSVPLYINDAKAEHDPWAAYSEIALNGDEFCVDCCMKFEAGEHGDNP